MIEDYYEYTLKKYFLGLYLFAVTTHDLELQAQWPYSRAHARVGGVEHAVSIPLLLLSPLNNNIVEIFNHICAARAPSCV